MKMKRWNFENLLNNEKHGGDTSGSVQNEVKGRKNSNKHRQNNRPSNHSDPGQSDGNETIKDGTPRKQYNNNRSRYNNRETNHRNDLRNGTQHRNFDREGSNRKFDRRSGNRNFDKEGLTRNYYISNHNNEYHKRGDNQSQADFSKNYSGRCERNGDGRRTGRNQNSNHNSTNKGEGHNRQQERGGGHHNHSSRPNDNQSAKKNDPKEREYMPLTPTEGRDELFASGIPAGVNFIKFDDIPDFVIKNVKRSGYSNPTPILKKAIPIILQQQCVYEVPKFEKRKKLIKIIEKEDPEGIMVFVQNKRNADFLASFLSEKQVLSTSVHGDRYQSQREEALRDFNSGKMKLLIATSVGARGLDIKNVRHVINFDLPRSIEEYVHRIGLMARVGNCGKATSFFDAEKDYPFAADLKKILHQAGQKVPDFLVDIDVPSIKHHANTTRGNIGGKDVRKGQNHRKSDRDNNEQRGDNRNIRSDETEEQWKYFAK